ncbi:MAG TPA: hypothetical protein VHQ94_17830 [Pyrinomonadaceae bacterium]|jgi:hypothetical protein|nr:hypothetical protein [Pyrinomonadaceae bacterium]
MNDWIGLAVIGFLVICGLVGLSLLGKPYDVSVEEFEKRAHEGPGLLGAGLVGLQKALDPAMEKAVEAQEDLRRGKYDSEDDEGDPPDAGDDRRGTSNDNTGEPA